MKDVIFGVESKNGYNDQYIKNCEYVGYRAEKVFPPCERGAFLAASIILQPLFLMVAYLSYFPAKLLSKIIGDYCLKASIKSLVDHSNAFFSAGQDCASAVTEVFNKIISYACAAII